MESRSMCNQYDRSLPITTSPNLASSCGMSSLSDIPLWFIVKNNGVTDTGEIKFNHYELGSPLMA
ncbi:unnamed protein product [Ceratitis capitata]|uniref:(Mediterranean fruit fly) hypothetical protein n=1 Tax=Ceratitis capitata TaxID=7213 RepID=A0A811USY6_CERCA|nr:unnamed protein product [Ceratitis capitata]